MPLQDPDPIDKPPPEPGRIRSWVLHALAVALALSLGANAWLARRVSALARPGVPALEAGAHVGDFSGGATR
jgi:hypothetical protein